MVQVIDNRAVIDGTIVRIEHDDGGPARIWLHVDEARDIDGFAFLAGAVAGSTIVIEHAAEAQVAACEPGDPVRVVVRIVRPGVAVIVE